MRHRRHHGRFGYASDRPGSQRIPQGFGLLFPKELEQLHARGDRADFIGVIANAPAAEAAAALQSRGKQAGVEAAVVNLSSLMLKLPVLTDLWRSDHAVFWEHGYPAVLLTDTADFRNPYYHCGQGPDVPEHLDLGFMTRVVRATVGAAGDLLQKR